MNQKIAILLALALASPGFATTFVDGTVNAGSSATVGSATDTFLSGPSSIAAPATVGTISTVIATENDYTARAFSFVQGDWISADAGSVLVQWGWDVRSSGSGLSTQVLTNLASANWSYTFTASGDGFFAGRYAVAALGDTFGLQPIYGTGDMPFGPYGGDVSDPTGSGNFSVALLSGQTYTMAFFNFGNINSAGDGFDLTGSASATVDWTISYGPAIPEPATWAMMIGGFGLVGAAARRRRDIVSA